MKTAIHYTPLAPLKIKDEGWESGGWRRVRSRLIHNLATAVGGKSGVGFPCIRWPWRRGTHTTADVMHTATQEHSTTRHKREEDTQRAVHVPNPTADFFSY